MGESKELTWRLCPFWWARPPAGSQPIWNAWRCQHQGSQGGTLVSSWSPRIQCIRHISCIMSDLPKPDRLHTMQMGMLDHLRKWMFHFMKMHKWLDKYNAIWLSVPAYHDLTPKNKTYEEVSQWNEKEMKKMSHYLLGVVTQSLRGGSPTQHPIFNRAMECTRALLEF